MYEMLVVSPAGFDETDCVMSFILRPISIISSSENGNGENFVVYLEGMNEWIKGGINAKLLS